MIPPSNQEPSSHLVNVATLSTSSTDLTRVSRQLTGSVGEAGKDFAVVANEIKELARRQTATATVDIKTLVARFKMGHRKRHW
jgi:hypothetical protein